MKREHIYLAVIASGLFVVMGAMIWSVWPTATESLPAPEVLAEEIRSDVPAEQKVEAAQNFIRHGKAAQTEVRIALTQYRQQEPEVVAPLVQATMKNRDYRSMPTLLELLEHEDPQVRGRAGAAVQKILGADFGFRANAPAAERATMVRFIRHDYQQALPRLPVVYEGQSE